MRNSISISIKLAVILVVLLLSCSDDDNPADGGNGIFSPTGMTLIQAKDMSFQMGSDNGFPDELPIHTVSFSCDFWMDTTEVTQGDYDELMVNMPDTFHLPGTSPMMSATDIPLMKCIGAMRFCTAMREANAMGSIRFIATPP